jgi:hypothetical protein
MSEMVSFSNDADIMKYEPILFGELHLPWQVLAQGSSGTLSGTTFTAVEADFISAQAAAGGVIYLQSQDNLLDGVYEIISVDSQTQLTISIIRPDSQSEVIAPPPGQDISYNITTLSPQANEAGFQLTEYFGIKPGNPASVYDVEDIFDTLVLRQASVFAVISNVYAMLAGRAKDDNCWNKSLYYHKLYNQARARIHLCIDAGDDGIVDVTQIGASGRLVRD